MVHATVAGQDILVTIAKTFAPKVVLVKNATKIPADVFMGVILEVSELSVIRHAP